MQDVVPVNELTITGDGPTDQLSSPTGAYPITPRSGVQAQTVGVVVKSARTPTITDVTVNVNGPVKYVSLSLGEGADAHSEVR